MAVVAVPAAARADSVTTFDLSNVTFDVFAPNQQFLGNNQIDSATGTITIDTTIGEITSESITLFLGNTLVTRLLPLVPVRLDIASARHNEILATARIMWREARTMGGRQP